MPDPLELIREDLLRVEAHFQQNTVSDVRVITEIGHYLQESGGKRLRPALVLLTARLCGCPEESMVRLAAIVEMIHSATLVHDDIIDGADMRRGRPSTNSRWGSHMSVLAGDWLYMQAFSLALEERRFEILDTLIGLTQNMVEGELIQFEILGRVVTREQHMDLIRRKTACLFEVSSKLGALAAGERPEVTQRLSCYGYHLGMAFQMVDDILDFTASAQTLGKPVGNDLREGKMTLPAIYAWDKASPDERRQLETVMHDGNYERVPFDEIRTILERYRALDQARQEGRQHAEQARQQIAGFPASPWREALITIPELLMNRDR